MTLAEMRTLVQDQLGAELTALYANIDDLCNAWLNEGLQRLDEHPQVLVDISWNAGDTEITTPAELAEIHEISRVDVPEGQLCPTFALWAGQLRFRYPISFGGSATIYARGAIPQLEADADETGLPVKADYACVAFAQYRFFHRLATSRSDYRRYATLVSQAAVSTDDLLDLALQHRAEFDAVVGTFPGPEPVTYYGA